MMFTCLDKYLINKQEEVYFLIAQTENKPISVILKAVLQAQKTLARLMAR